MREKEVLQKRGFWVGKMPCWEVRHCIAEARELCRAYRDQSRPCWEHDDPLCRQLFKIDTCFVCKVFKRYGRDDGEEIE